MGRHCSSAKPELYVLCQISHYLIVKWILCFTRQTSINPQTLDFAAYPVGGGKSNFSATRIVLLFLPLYIIPKTF
jgi:hypothetical protein